MTFTLAWIDHDQEARKRAHELLGLFNQPGSREEMGLGTIRDAFSNLLFPGTNTLQTRLRFSLIVPWVYRALEREETPGADIWRLGRERELDVLEHLWATNEKGVYGRRSRRRLKGTPELVLRTGRCLGVARPCRWQRQRGADLARRAAEAAWRVSEAGHAVAHLG